MKKLALASAFCLALISPASAQCPEAGSLTYATTLFGSEFGGAGSPSGFGSGFVTIDPNTNRITVNLTVHGIGSNVTGAALFAGTRAGAFADAALPFTDETNTFDEHGTFSRTLTVPASLIGRIVADPDGYRVGVTTAEAPFGALTGALTQVQTYGGALSGTSVIGANGESGRGAADAGGAFSAQILPSANGGSALSFVFAPSGIGSTFTALTLNQGTAGNNGPALLTLASGGTVVKGKYSGSVPLTTAQAQQLMFNPESYYVMATTPLYPNGAVRAEFGATHHEVWLPAVGSVTGIFGIFWATDVRVFNRSFGMPATVMVEFFPSDQNNAAGGAMQPTDVATVTVGARGSKALDRVLRSLFSIENGFGALRITSDQPVVVVSRTYSDRSSEGRGTLGQTTVGMTRCGATALGVIPGVVGATASGFDDLTQRTNLGFFNPNGSAVRAKVRITDSDGNLADGTYEMTMQPYSLTQMPMTGPAGAGAMFSVHTNVGAGAVSFQSTAPIFAYASIVDNASADTSVVFAQPDETIAMQLSLPAVAYVWLVTERDEIQLAGTGQSRATAQSARDLAQQIVTEHNASFAQAKALFSNLGITPTASNVTGEFIDRAAQTIVTGLNGVPAGAAFDRAFMQGIVDLHHLILANVDDLLIPSAQGNAQLLQFLQSERATAAAHLAAAQQILAGL